MLSITDIPHLGALEPEKCWVYALVDPRTDEVRYIGSSLNVPERTRAHINGFSGSQTLGKWVRSLRREGLRPRVFLLQLIPEPERRFIAEIQWIHGCLERGANLLNVIHSRRRFNGLSKREICTEKYGNYILDSRTKI